MNQKSAKLLHLTSKFYIASATEISLKVVSGRKLSLIEALKLKSNTYED